MSLLRGAGVSPPRFGRFPAIMSLNKRSALFFLFSFWGPTDAQIVCMLSCELPFFILSPLFASLGNFK